MSFCCRHTEGEEYKFWIDYFNSIIDQHNVNEFRWNDDPFVTDDYINDFMEFVDNLFLENRFVKHMSPLVSFDIKAYD